MTTNSWVQPIKKHSIVPICNAPNSARARQDYRVPRSKISGAQSLTRPASSTRNGSRFRNEKSKLANTMKGPLDKKLAQIGSSSTQNLHAHHTMKLQKYVVYPEDDFLKPSHHHQSVQIFSKNDIGKTKSLVCSNFNSQNRIDSIPIGPQKTKSQVQANQK